jgi:hypothetical protein
MFRISNKPPFHLVHIKKAMPLHRTNRPIPGTKRGHMTNELPRVLSRPSGLPLYAWIAPDGVVIGLQSFENPSCYPGDKPQADGRRCLPMFGEEPPGPFDEDRQYFADDYTVDGDRVIRMRTVRDREGAAQ